MAKTQTTTITFSDILKRAKLGTYKLPAFQRKWKWTTKQVMSLFDSLRLGYPVGAFLFLTSDDAQKLGPRSFYGTGEKASSNLKFESLVLDGQQRITAGLSIYYGLEEVEGSEYYIDLKILAKKIADDKINIDDEAEVITFCSNLDIDDGYLVAKKRKSDRASNFYQKSLLWTPYLTEERQNDLDTLLENSEDKELNRVIKKVARRFLKPNVNIQIPVIELGSDFDLGAISKVFSTINSTGKLLTPFELVVAILYPHDITLEDDVSEFKTKYPYYNNMDKNGEILLQTIALLGKKSPKKSDLPKNIDEETYKAHSSKAATYLNNLGQFLSQSLGVGLDVTDKLIPYDAIFAPMALCYQQISIIKGHSDKARAYLKLKRWFVVSAITQRYQEGVHNKQSNDLRDINKWILKDSEMPEWIKDGHVTVAIKNASTSGAIGKLFLCLLNSNNPKDPVLGEAIGFRDKVHFTQIHHIFPTKWVSKGIDDYVKEKLDTNLALNTMLLSSTTNADWLNFDPKTQIKQSVKGLGSRRNMEENFEKQMINQKGIELLEKETKYIETYNDFILNRYKSFVIKLQEFGINEAEKKEDYPTELESPSIVNEP